MKGFSENEMPNQISSNEYLGCGIYTLTQASRLLQVHHNTMYRWTGDRPDGEGIVHRQFQPDRVLTFAELMELHFIKMFREHDVPLQVIRRASRSAARQFDARHPFSVKRFDTDGRTIFATLRKAESDDEIVKDLQHGQLVFQKFIKPFFRKLDYGAESETVTQFWPMQKRGRVVLDPRRSFGQPIDAKSGVPVEAIVNALATGEDSESVAKWFDIPVGAVKSAKRFDQLLSS